MRNPKQVVACRHATLSLLSGPKRCVQFAENPLKAELDSASMYHGIMVTTVSDARWLVGAGNLSSTNVFAHKTHITICHIPYQIPCHTILYKMYTPFRVSGEIMVSSAYCQGPWPRPVKHNPVIEFVNSLCKPRSKVVSFDETMQCDNCSSTNQLLVASCLAGLDAIRHTIYHTSMGNMSYLTEYTTPHNTYSIV